MPHPLPQRTIRLSDPFAPEVHPHDDEFPAFPLPSFPLSQEGWLIGLAQRFHRRHHHGLAVLLLMNVQMRIWFKPHLPTQRCTREGASFKLQDKDFQGMNPAHRIAGSFQWSRALNGDDAHSMVPAFDGLHMIGWNTGEEPHRHLFLRVDGVIRAVDRSDIVFNDWEEYLDQHRDLLLVA